MPAMISEVYDALREAGAGEEKSRKAAEAVFRYDTAISDMLGRLRVIEVMSAFNITLSLLIIGKLVLF